MVPDLQPNTIIYLEGLPLMIIRRDLSGIMRDPCLFVDDSNAEGSGAPSSCCGILNLVADGSINEVTAIQWLRG